MTSFSKLSCLCLGLFIVFLIIVIIGVATYAAVPRIIGGTDAPDGKYRFLASLHVYDDNVFGFSCAGSIIHKRWILTTDSCFKRAASSSLKVNVGPYHPWSKKSRVYQVEYRTVYRRIIDENVDGVGLVRVDKDIAFDDEVQPVRLTDKDFNKACYPVTVLGWGFLESKGTDKYPRKLQQITLKTLGQRVCRRKLAGIFEINRSHICTLNEDYHGVCTGDSGAPLIADGVQIGIVIVGSRPCAIGEPDVYHKVYPLLNWIKNVQARYDD